MSVVVRIPCNLFRSPRVLTIPRVKRAEAMGVYLVCLCYSREYELDGWVPLGALESWNGEPLVDILVSAKLVVRENDGLRLVDYELWNETKAQIEYKKRIGRERKASFDIRSAVLLRDGYVCGLCGSHVHESDVEYDHIIPVSKGGKTTVQNLRVTHSRCNRARGNRDDDQSDNEGTRQ